MKNSGNLIAPLVSIVILNYNGFEHLKTCLDSVLKTNYPNFEIIVVDNGSTDGSVDFVKNNYPMVKLLRLPKNFYTAGGYMAGIYVAKGKYVAVLNNDIEVDRDWLKHLIDTMERMPWVVAADAKFRNFYHRDMFDDSAAAGRWIDYCGNNYTRGVNEVDRGQYDRLAYIIGVLTIFRKDIVMKVGGFDISYLFGYEDIDLGWRLNIAGYKALYVPQAVIYHKSGASSRDSYHARKLRPEFYYLVKRNRLITLIKNLSIVNMIIALAITILEYYFSMWYLLLLREKVYGIQIARAVFYVFRNLKKIMKVRASVQQLRVLSDKDVRKLMVPYCGEMVKVLYRRIGGRW